MGLFSIGRKRKLLFVGPPRSGKTVFFSTMVDLLICKAGKEGSLIACDAEGRHSEKFVRSVLRSLEEQVWPKEGGAADAHGELVYTLTHKGNMYDSNYTITCCDYAGETFNAAYGDPDTLESDIDDDQVEDLKRHVNSADIVFVIVDAVRLHDGNCPDIEDSLFGVAEVLKKRKIRTAFVLTQRDEFSDEDQWKIVEQLKTRYRNIYRKLEQIPAEYFWVSSVVATTDKQGRRVPPKHYQSGQHSIDLLAPINWALSLPQQD